MPREMVYLDAGLIRGEMIKRGWEQKQLAAKAGIDAKLIRTALSPDGKASLRTLSGIAKAFAMEDTPSKLLDKSRQPVTVTPVINLTQSESPQSDENIQTDELRYAVTATVTFELNVTDHKAITRLIDDVHDKANMYGRVAVTKIQYGSVLVDLLMDREDLLRLIEAFASGVLASLHCRRISLTTENVHKMFPQLFVVRLLPWFVTPLRPTIMLRLLKQCIPSGLQLTQDDGHVILTRGPEQAKVVHITSS